MKISALFFAEKKGDVPTLYSPDRKAQKKRKQVCSCFLSKELISLFRRAKGVLVQPADGADPIFGNILPGRARSDTVFRVAQSGVIDIAAGALVLHGKGPFLTCRSSA